MSDLFHLKAYRTPSCSSCPSENSDLVGLVNPNPSVTFVAVAGLWEVE